MKVLNVNFSLDPVSGGGTAERTVQLSRAFARDGMETTLLTAGDPLTPGTTERLAGVRVEVLPALPGRLRFPLVLPGRLHRLVAASDVVHLCNHWTALNILVQRAAKAAGKPYVVCPAGALPAAGRSLYLKRVYNQVAGTRLIREASGWVSITEPEALDFAAYGVDPRNVTLIPNGVAPEDFVAGDPTHFRAFWGLGNRRIVLFLGRLNRIKGPDLLLEAFLDIADRLPEHALVIAGPDEGMADALRVRIAGSSAKDRVILCGHLGGAAKVSALRAAELLVVPSRREAMSLVALEAGACGIPVLLTDQCGFPPSEGVTIVPASAEALAPAMLRLVRDPASLSRCGATFRATVMAQYSWAIAASRYKALFTRLLTQPRH